MDYFERNHITWWMGDKKNEPTGHLLSSQVACINHLYFARQRKDVATAILKSVDSSSLKSWILPSKSRKMLSGHKF
ncbi:MAG: hypothetical protein BA865_04050 [Desulfobacterales bacterium S5133MH4]|nr:MAG: hypothetical protein BA865_04050 [Desulfobacterales bacterium S5133MH4]